MRQKGRGGRGLEGTGGEKGTGYVNRRQKVNKNKEEQKEMD